MPEDESVGDDVKAHIPVRSEDVDVEVIVEESNVSGSLDHPPRRSAALPTTLDRTITGARRSSTNSPPTKIRHVETVRLHIVDWTRRNLTVIPVNDAKKVGAWAKSLDLSHNRINSGRNLHHFTQVLSQIVM